MTYSQIERIENFISQIKTLKNSGWGDTDYEIVGDEFKAELEKVHFMISSSVPEYKPEGINWNRAYVTNSYGSYPYGYYNSQEIDRIADIMLSCLNGILSSIPEYPMICSLKEDIAEGKANTKKSKVSYIVRMNEKYSSILSFSNEVNDLVKRVSSGQDSGGQTLIDSLYQGVIEKLKLYLNDICSDKSNKSEKASPLQINVNQNNNQTVAIDINIEIENCYKALDDCESISEGEISEIKSKLAEIEGLLKEGKGKRKPIRERIQGILKWLANKSAEAMIAVLPTLVTILTQIK